MDTKDIRKLKEGIVFRANLCGNDLTFHSTWGLFSPREIDEGTRLLLEYANLPPKGKILDLGCGYGAIGIALAKGAPERKVHLVDTDFVAVEYAKRNAAINGVAKNCEIYLSNGFSGVPEKLKFDAVVSNIPAKVGRELLWIWLADAKERLNDGGEMCVVTVSGLREFIKKNFMEAFGNYEKVKQGARYTVARAVKTVRADEEDGFQ